MSVMLWIGLFLGTCGGLFLGGLLCAASRAGERAEGAVGRGLHDVPGFDGRGPARPVYRAGPAPEEVPEDQDPVLHRLR